ncbi:MAG: glycosyltransferase family 39 protein [candidate division FCPU426 bacterium]
MALLLGLAAGRLVHSSTWLALGLWAVGGFILAMAGRDSVSGTSESVQAWEAPAFLLLFAAAACVRLYRLPDFPPGSSFPEIAAIGKAHFVENSYTPHAVDFHVGWPTLTFYQGLLFEKIFGPGLSSWRAISGFWSLLAFGALLAALRAWTGALPALLVGIVALASNLDTAVSRIFYSSSVLLFGLAACLYFVARARKREGKASWFLAGLCGGLLMHGYYPGRVGFAFVAFWMLLFARSKGGSRKDALLPFYAGLMLMASPVLIWGMVHYGEFWGHIRDMDPNRSQGFTGYWKTFMEQLPVYLSYFHLRPDGRYNTDDGLPMLSMFGADTFTGALFPLGVFAALFLLRRPLAFFIAAGLLAGLVPGIFGSNFPHPTSRRVILALQPAYVAAAFALYLSFGALATAKTWLRRAVPLLLLLLAVGSATMAIRAYFVQVMGSVEMEVQWNRGAHIADQIFRKEPDAERIIGAHLFHPSENAILQEDISRIRVARDPEDYLRLSTGKYSVWAMDPYLEKLLPEMLRWFPNAKTEKFTHEPTAHLETREDPLNRNVWFIKLSVPKEDRLRFQGFAKVGSNRAGVLITPHRQTQVTFHGPSGSGLRVNGRHESFGQPVFILGRSAFVELVGAGESFTFSALDDDGKEIYPASMLPLGQAHGWGVSYHSRKNPENKTEEKVEATGYELFPPRRIWDMDPLRQPGELHYGALWTPAARFQGRLRVNADDAPWSFMVDGKLVSQMERGGGDTKAQSLIFEAGHTYRLEVHFRSEYIVPWLRNFAPEMVAAASGATLTATTLSQAIPLPELVPSIPR